MSKLVPVVPVVKDPNTQSLIPTAWRGTLAAIVDALKEGDFQLARGILGVPALNPRAAQMIEENILDYGVHLISLPEETWNSSACQWMGSYWDLLVDLFTKEEGASDLILAVRVRESCTGFVFDVHSVHVP